MQSNQTILSPNDQSIGRDASEPSGQCVLSAPYVDRRCILHHSAIFFLAFTVAYTMSDDTALRWQRITVPNRSERMSHTPHLNSYFIHNISKIKRSLTPLKAVHR